MWCMVWMDSKWVHKISFDLARHHKEYYKQFHTNWKEVTKHQTHTTTVPSKPNNELYPRRGTINKRIIFSELNKYNKQLVWIDQLSSKASKPSQIRWQIKENSEEKWVNLLCLFSIKKNISRIFLFPFSVFASYIRLHLTGQSNRVNGKHNKYWRNHTKQKIRWGQEVVELSARTFFFSLYLYMFIIISNKTHCVIFLIWIFHIFFIFFFFGEWLPSTPPPSFKPISFAKVSI